MAGLRPWTDLPNEEAKRLRGLLFDLDDTFLDGGRLSQDAYSALFDLERAGLALVAVTGRPAMWGELICRQWPLLGAVTENGNIVFTRIDGRVRALDPLGVAERAERRSALTDLAAELSEAFPGLQAADDNPARRSDYAFDIGEHAQVPPTKVQEIMDFARGRGAKTQRSSVHLHITFDRQDKASGTLGFLRRVAGEDATSALSRYAFVGDSENDAACFAAFRTSIAVANLRGRPSVLPRFITRSARSAGFIELAAHLIQARDA